MTAPLPPREARLTDRRVTAFMEAASAAARPGDRIMAGVNLVRGLIKRLGDQELADAIADEYVTFTHCVLTRLTSEDLTTAAVEVGE